MYEKIPTHKNEAGLTDIALLDKISILIDIENIKVGYYTKLRRL